MGIIEGEKMMSYTTIKDILSKTKYSVEALDMIDEMVNKTDLIDVDQAKIIADNLHQREPLQRLPTKGTISNWICEGRLRKHGTNYRGPRSGRPKVLISESEFIELLRNQPPMGRRLGYRKSKAKRLEAKRLALEAKRLALAI